MADSFNPYCQWLGFPDGRQPANHYALLGVAPFERDLAAIARAADTLIARVRTIRPGPYLAQWQQLLDELARARACLTDPHAKAAYDAALQSPGAQPQPPAAPPQPASAEPPVSTPQSAPPQQVASTPRSMIPPQPPPIARTPASNQAGHADPPNAPPSQSVAVRGEPTTKYRRRAGIPVVQIILWGFTLAALAVAGVLGAKLLQEPVGVATNESSQQDGSERPTVSHRNRSPGRHKSLMSPVLPGASDASEIDQPQGTPPLGTIPQNTNSPQATAAAPPSNEPEPVATNPPNSPADRVRAEALERQLNDVRAFMADHEIQTAREQLATAAQMATSPEEKAEVDRLDTLLGHLDSFWKGMRRVVAKLGAAEALPVGDTYVAIVESSAEEIMIKVEGQIRSYAVNRMPPKLVQALASAKLASDPATKVLVGTYLAVDRKGDPARARQLWAEATQEGMDVAALLPELDHAGWGRVIPAATRTTGRKEPPTDEAKLAELLASVRQTYRTELASAKSPIEKSNLAATMVTVAESLADSDTRFVMLREARDLTIAAGDLESAMGVIEKLADAYQIDTLAMQANVLLEGAKHVRGLNGQKGLAQGALDRLVQAVASKRLDLARPLADVALAAARKSKSRTLMQKAVAAQQELDRLEKSAN